MNNYPVWWDTTLTIYNRYEDPQTNVIRWYRTQISSCFWKYVGDKVNINNSILETNNIICRIPKNARFLEAYQWQKLPNDQMSEYFTLSPQDIIVKGSVEDTIEEYVNGHRSSDILAKYKQLQGCMQVEQVSINIGEGRCDEHYYVKGV